MVRYSEAVHQSSNSGSSGYDGGGTNYGVSSSSSGVTKRPVSGLLQKLWSRYNRPRSEYSGSAFVDQQDFTYYKVSRSDFIISDSSLHVSLLKGTTVTKF